MNDLPAKIRIAAVGDIHVKASDKGKWINYFREVSRSADILLITGDLTDTGDIKEAQVLAEELKACNIPVIAVLGNHDYERAMHKDIRHLLKAQNIYVLDGESVVISDIGFAGIKGFGGGFDNFMLSMFGEQEMKAFVQEAVNETLHLDRALARLDQEYDELRKKIVLMHYAPVKATVIGEPEQIYPFLGCSRLAEPLLRRQVDMVFHGHAHAGTLEGSLGNITKIYNVAMPILVKAGYTYPFYLLEF